MNDRTVLATPTLMFKVVDGKIEDAEISWTESVTIADEDPESDEAQIVASFLDVPLVRGVMAAALRRCLVA